MKYSEKFKDPRWQRKRLEVLKRDDFTCLACRSTKKQLHVHHCYYVSQRDPWDYSTSSLLTLCEECHEWVNYQTHPAFALSSSFEIPALIEIQRHLDNLKHGACDPDEGVLWAIRESARQMKMPLSEALNLFYDAASSGALTEEVLRKAIKDCKMAKETRHENPKH